jgi:uncharacterized protein (DUF362 family)
VIQNELTNYPLIPYNPPEEYVELSNLPYTIQTDIKNNLYKMTRDCLSLHGLDSAKIGDKNWNPLSEIISPNNTVVLKPNLVKETHPLGEKGVLSTITHPSLLRPIIDYCILALKGKGKIIVCDAPLQSTDFEKLVQNNGLKQLIDFYNANLKNSKISISLLDLRSQKIVISQSFKKDKLVNLPGDPLGYTIIDLKNSSYHTEISQHWKKFLVTNYRLDNLRKYHNTQKHCYYIPNTVLSADVILSIPKLKTHKKAGITVAQKNFIGINASKDFLPHHRTGLPHKGGDEYDPVTYKSVFVKDKFFNFMAKVPVARRIGNLIIKLQNTTNAAIIATVNSGTTEGSWHGNDTIWRTILDLNIIIKYAKKDGSLSNHSQRNLLVLVDGIIGQESEGPMNGNPKECGIILLGTNPCAVDYVASKLMGLNTKWLKQVYIPFKKTKTQFPLVTFSQAEIIVKSNKPEYRNIHLLTREKSLKLKASNGWKILETD